LFYYGGLQIRHNCEDQKPLRFGKKKKNIFGCHSVNAAACEKTPRRSQKGLKRIGYIKPMTASGQLFESISEIRGSFSHIMTTNRP
jgi:hypothetical protein